MKFNNIKYTTPKEIEMEDRKMYYAQLTLIIIFLFLLIWAIGLIITDIKNYMREREHRLRIMKRDIAFSQRQNRRSKNV